MPLPPTLDPSDKVVLWVWNWLTESILGTTIVGGLIVGWILTRKKKKVDPMKLDYETKRALDDLGRVVQTASIEASNASMKVERVSETMSEKLDGYGKEQREYLENMRTAVMTSLSEVHEKANDAKLTVASLEGRVVALEKQRAS